MKLLKFVFIACFIFALFFSVDVSAVDVIGSACDELTAAERRDSAACQDNVDQPITGNALYGPNGLLTRVASLIAVIVGIAAVIMIIISGFKYITSSGDPNNIKSAKDTLIYAIVGILVAITAQSIVVLVLSRL